MMMMIITAWPVERVKPTQVEKYRRAGQAIGNDVAQVPFYAG
jgi:hypothetical protein